MFQKQFILWWQQCLHSLVVHIADKAVVRVCIIAGVLGILLSNAPASNAQVVSSPAIAVTTQQLSTTKHNQYQQTALKTTVYRSPDCICCGGWIKHLKSQGFEVVDFPTTNIEAIKHKYNVPDNLTSCHTAIIDGYVIEGHVPAQDIKRLLREQTKVAGLSVPQMPVGTPGMEMANRKDPFSVIFFEEKGTVGVFSNYPAS